MSAAAGKGNVPTRRAGHRLRGEAQGTPCPTVGGGAHGGPLYLDRDEALRYLGYAGQPMDPDLLSRFEEIADECERDLRPSWVYVVFDHDEGSACPCVDGPEAGQVAEGDRVRPTAGEPSVGLVGTSLVLPGADIADHVRGACKVALMACTLGIASERALRIHAAVSPTDALLYDAAASALVEAAANEAENAIVAQATAEGLHAGSRFSPGYGDFPLSVQPAFLAAVDAARRIGLTATESFMLVPSKSVTAVVGLFERPRLTKSSNAECGSCRLRDHCHLVKKGGTCHG